MTDRGYHEAITYSFVDATLQQLISPNKEALVLANPMSSEMSEMRMSMWPGLINALRYNQHRQRNRVRFYETGLCFNKQGPEIEQEMRIGGIVCGTVYPEQWATNLKAVDFFDVKADLEALLQLSLTAHNYQFVASEHAALHPGQSAEIRKGHKVAGYLGKIHPEIEQKLALPENVYLFELNLADVLTASLPHHQILSKFPLIRRDLAILVAQNIAAQDIQQSILQTAGMLLKGIHVFDVYQGKGIQEGYKSLAIGITLQHDTRTLIEQEVTDIINRIMARLKQQFDAILRD